MTLTGEVILDAKANIDPYNSYTVDIKMNSEGRWLNGHEFTGSNIEIIAIILDEVVEPQHLLVKSKIPGGKDH